MITDKNLELSLAQALTATAASTNHIDQLAKGDAMDGSEVYLVVRCGTLLNSAGNGATLKIGIESDSDSGFATNKIEHAAKTIAEASIAANSVLWKTKLPLGLQRYVRLYYTVTGENFTSGTIDAMITPNIDVSLPQ